MCSKLKQIQHDTVLVFLLLTLSQYINIVFLLLILKKYVPAGCERRVIMFSKHKKAMYLFYNEICKTYFIQQFITVPNWNKLWPAETYVHNMFIS